MGNEGSIPSDTESQASDWQSLYSYTGSRAGRRSSLGSMRIPSPMEPPEPDLSHLSPDEVAKIREVIGRAKTLKQEEHKRIRKLEEEYVTYASDVERRASEAVSSAEGFSKDTPLCPICLKSELIIKEGKMTDGQNVCTDCGNLTCLKCGDMEQSVTSKELEWVCHVCHKRRQLVLSSGLWHPGCDVDDDVPLSREVDRCLQELQENSLARGPLVRSTSLDASGAAMSGSSIQRQMSLPDYKMPPTYSAGHMLEAIQESTSGNVSPEPNGVGVKGEVPDCSEDVMKKSTGSTNSAGSLRAMGQPSSRSESEYSDGISDIEMEDASMMRSGTDGISPDDGSDDYSFMSIGSSDDNSGIVRRKHRPKSLNLSRSISATSSEDETSDSAISTDVESKYGPVPPPDQHDIRIALAASAFVEEMRGVDMNNETDDEIAEISAQEAHIDSDKVRFSPSVPVSPSWREGLESPPFSPRRRDSYPGKRRGSSPVSPKDKRFTYTDISPPSRQLSLEELYDKDAITTKNDPNLVPIAQRPSPKSPDEMKDSFYSTSGDVLSFDRPTSSLKKSKPFYSLDDATMDLNDTTTVMDLATYAATVASNTANLTSMTVSPTNIDDNTEVKGIKSPERSRSTSPVSPGYYDNVPYPDESNANDHAGDADLADPSQKSIDYQGTKRQKARPPTTDWSPVIDLSPILDVSPSLEEAEQAEMEAQQQEERQRQASREDDEYSPINTFVAAAGGEALTEDDYKYYGLKRYEVVEDISELVKQNNGNINDTATIDSNTERIASISSNSSSDNGLTINSNIAICTSIAPTNLSNTSSTSQAGTFNTDSNERSSNKKSSTQGLDLMSSPKGQHVHSAKNTESNIVEPKSNPTTSGKIRRKLPEPTAEIIATQKAPIPKPRRTDKPTEPPPIPQKPTRVIKQGSKEPTRNAPTLPTNSNSKTVAGRITKQHLQRQDSDERRKTAKEMKAKPDPIIMNHIEIEEASSSPQYKVLESPPSPENKAAIRREYSDSTSVSPSSSPDRELYLYPSPVTPPDSDSSPPKPHSPSSGTDFEEEFIFLEESPEHSPKPKPRDMSRHVNGGVDKRSHHNKPNERNLPEKQQSIEKECPTKAKQQSSPQSKDHKQKDMKKIRRKLPPIPSEDELQNQKPKQRPTPPRKPTQRPDTRTGRKKAGASSTSDDSSMNEDDKEVASITRKKSTNDLDKPSQDKRNGNYIIGSSNGKVGSYLAEDALQVNIPPDQAHIPNAKSSTSKGKYHDETDEIIDSLIKIYGAPITQAMRGLKRRLQDEIRRVTEGRRRKIENYEELRALKIQLGDLKLGTDKNRTINKTNSVPGPNGKNRNSSNSRTSPQSINRRARHKRQSSDPMIAKFSPIKEDKDIESEMQVVAIDDNRSCKTGDDSSQSGISDTDSTRSEPIRGVGKYKKVNQTDYAKMFYSSHAQSSETLDKSKVSTNSPHLISSHSEGNLPVNADDEDFKMREEKRRELQFEIEKRKKQLAERQAQLKEARRQSIGETNKQLAHSCDEISNRIIPPSYIPPRPIPTGIIKPIDDQDESLPYKSNCQNQASYSSTEYLAHKQEELMKQRFDDLSSFSSPFLYSADFGEKSAFVPQITKCNLDSYSYSTGNVNMGKDIAISSSATLPNIQTSSHRTDIENNNRTVSDTESSPPSESTPAMPLLTDVKARSRKIIHDIGSGSRPVSAEFNVGVEDLMNGMYRVESDNSVDADEPIMKHMTEGGVTILKQLERKKQPQPSKPKKYDFPVKRILLTTDPKEKYGKGRPGNSIGMKIVGGKCAPGAAQVGAYVTAIYKGGVADQLHGEVNEGTSLRTKCSILNSSYNCDQILEWNGIDLSGRSYEDVQQLISQPNGEIDLVIRPAAISKKVLGDTTAQAPSCHSSYDNLDSDEETETPSSRKPSLGVDPSQLAAKLEGIEEDDSPSLSHSSSQQDYNTASASSGCSSPLSEPTSTSSDQHSRSRRNIATATASVKMSSSNRPRGAQPLPNPNSTDNRNQQYSHHRQQQQQQQQPKQQNYNKNNQHRPPPYQQQPPAYQQVQQHSPAHQSHHHYQQQQQLQQHNPLYGTATNPTQRLTPSSSDYFRRTHTPDPGQRNNSRPSSAMDSHSGRGTHHEQTRTKHLGVSDNQKQSEFPEPRKRELNQQSNSFDDFIRMSQHAGVEARQTSPSKLSSHSRHSKRALSVSATELTQRKAMDAEDDIQKSERGSSRGDRQMGDIQLQLKHDENNSEFRVKVLQARNLLPKDLNGLSDPFVKIYLLPGRCSDNKRRTKHIARTLNPEWKETLTFPNVHAEEMRNKTLEITVWDYDRFKANDFLGEVVLNLSEEAFLDNLPHWYPLCEHDESKHGMELPQPTVLPPKPLHKTNNGSPRAKSRDRMEKGNHQSGATRNDRVRQGLGRRRRSFDTLQDVDKV